MSKLGDMSERAMRQQIIPDDLNVGVESGAPLNGIRGDQYELPRDRPTGGGDLGDVFSKYNFFLQSEWKG